METSVTKPVNRINLSEAIKLRFINGLTEPEIARKYGVSKPAVNKALKPYKQLFNTNLPFKAFQDNYTNILKNVNHTLIADLMNPDKRKKASLNNISYAQNNIYNQIRLEEGKSTENVSVHGAVNSLQKSQDQLDNVKRKILESVDNPGDNT